MSTVKLPSPSQWLDLRSTDLHASSPVASEESGVAKRHVILVPFPGNVET